MTKTMPLLLALMLAFGMIPGMYGGCAVAEAAGHDAGGGTSNMTGIPACLGSAALGTPELDSRIQWLANIYAGEPSAPIIHFSFDDVVLTDIVSNSEKYASIWDAPDFAALKAAHDASGCCITLNLFTGTADFDVTALPAVAAWQNELQAAKTWLRFAYHGKDNDKTSAPSASEYADFVTGVYNLTGDHDCIDRIARLGYFNGTADQMEALVKAEHGLIGFLCADSEGRFSYDLTAAQVSQVWDHGRFFDTDRQYIFIKSMPRIDRLTAEEAIALVQADIPKSTKIVEIFTHAPINSAKARKFSDIAKWAADNGFFNAFPMDMYK